MEIIVTGRRVEVSERFRANAQEKLRKIAQFSPRAMRVSVELSHERNPRQSHTCDKVEITVAAKGPVVRAEACAEDPLAALDLAVDKLFERLRRMGDRRKVHHGHRTPVSVHEALATGSIPVPALAGAPLNGVPAARTDTELDIDPRDEISRVTDDPADCPVVIRSKDHAATPMTLDQALYEMELVGHDFFLFVDAETARPSVVYRRRGWDYGVIHLDVAAAVAAV